jgi:hypothetical protein
MLEGVRAPGEGRVGAHVRSPKTERESEAKPLLGKAQRSRIT